MPKHRKDRTRRRGRGGHLGGSVRNIAFLPNSVNMSGNPIEDKNMLLRTLGSANSTMNSRNYSIVATESTNSAHRAAVAKTVNALKETKRNLRTKRPIYREQMNIRRARVPAGPPAPAAAVNAIGNAIFGRKTANSVKESKERAKYVGPREYPSPADRMIGEGNHYKSAEVIGLFRLIDNKDLKYVVEYVQSEPDDASRYVWLLVKVAYYGDAYVLVKVETSGFVRDTTVPIATSAPSPTTDSKFNNFMMMMENLYANAEPSEPEQEYRYDELLEDIVEKVKNVKVPAQEKVWWWWNTSMRDKEAGQRFFWDDIRTFMRHDKKMVDLLTWSPEDLKYDGYERLFDEKGIVIYRAKLRSDITLVQH
jgi:hypothetical protein